MKLKTRAHPVDALSLRKRQRIYFPVAAILTVVMLLCGPQVAALVNPGFQDTYICDSTAKRSSNTKDTKYKGILKDAIQNLEV